MRTLLFISLMAVGLLAHAEERTRTVPAFSAISSTGPISITVEVGTKQSVVVSGNDKFQNTVAMEVIGDELVITTREKEFKSMSSDQKIIVHMPLLYKFRVEGAGESILNNVIGERLDITYLGAGHLAANGKVKSLLIKAKGVGLVETKELIAENAWVEFEGVGAVKVYASESLTAKVSGVGSLNYYGNPRHVKKSAQGIGEVRAGD